MLLRFGASNHRSIRDYQQIVLTASSLKDSESGLLYPANDLENDIEDKKRLRVVPVVAIYGANAAGKSNLLKAFQFYVEAIQHSHSRGTSKSGTPYEPFALDESSDGRLSEYDADFVIGALRYHYGFTLDGEAIRSEWLYVYPSGGKRQVRTVLFHRDSSQDDEYYFGKSLKGENRVISRLTRSNSLFLSSAAQNSHPQLSVVYDYFKLKVSIQMDGDISLANITNQALKYFGKNSAMRVQAVSFLRSADIGISSMDFVHVPLEERTKSMLGDLEKVLEKYVEKDVDLSGYEKYKVELLHTGFDGKEYKVGLDDESSGTSALLRLLGPVFQKLISGGVLMIDELNTCLHPIVSRELIRLFSSPATNPGQAQLIFSTHDTTMLVTGLLRRDQIWFAEKDHTGSSVYYSLGDIKVRAGDNFERGYMDGRFGAIPLFGISALECEQIGVASELEG